MSASAQNTTEQPARNATAQGQNLPVTGNQVLHILVGHSAVIRTEARLKRVLIGNPAVLTTTTTAPNELVATAPAPGSSSLIMWLADGSSRIVEVFADLDVSMLRESVQRAFPDEALQVQAEESKVMLAGTASTAAVAEQLAKMAAPFSKDVVDSVQIAQPGRLKQVLLKVRFAEVDRTKLDALGINIFSTGAGNTLGNVTTQQFGSVGLGDQKLTSIIGAHTHGFTSQLTFSDLLNLFIFRPDLNLGATVRALQQKNVLQILAEPDLMAVSGEPAKFLAGGELPYPVVQPTAGGLNTVTIQFRPFGVRLEFTGTIQPDNTIRLKVAPEVSSLDFSNAVTIAGTVLPALSTRRAETVIELKPGQSFGIAGLLDQRTTAQMNKIPGIGDIPILGHLFRSKSLNKSSSELVVLVTPTIVDPIAAPPAIPETPKMPIPFVNPGEFNKQVPGGQPGGHKK